MTEFNRRFGERFFFHFRFKEEAWKGTGKKQGGLIRRHYIPPKVDKRVPDSTASHYRR
jgi:hypothetical protein